MSAELFVELRTEELPASMVRPALQGLRDGVVGLLTGISYGAVRTFATPRRLAVAVADVAPARPVEEKVVTGPPADRAFQDGKPTQAAIGFARGKGVDPSAIEVVDGPKGQVIAVRVTQGGEATAHVVADGLEGVIRGLPFKKAMEWNTGGLRFGRPLQSIVALYDGEVLRGGVNGVAFGDRTEGHRLAADTAFTVTSCDQWLTALRERSVEPDLDVRKRRIREILDTSAIDLGGDRIHHDALLEEVTHLVEWPVQVIGTFDHSLLALPHRLLETSMKQHQRYFPVHQGGKLTNRFVVISNNPWGDPVTVAEGNARVLRARFYDARFFLAEDRKKPLERHAEKLGRMTWIQGLGTMAEKSARVSATAGRLASVVGAAPEVATKAGALCKADLCTQMVGEFPELQGHMGRLYAEAEGLPYAVAVAIEEHYRPAGADDALPGTEAGAAVALADRLDTLVGCFSIGMVPKGSGDPQGLRRAAGGVLRILEGRHLRVGLRDLFRAAAHAYDSLARSEQIYTFDLVFVTKDGQSDAASVDKLVDQLVEFTLTRFKAAAVVDGVTADLADAVIAVGDDDVHALRGRLDAVRALAGTERFPAVLELFKRVLNITTGQDFPAPARKSLAHPAEAALASALDAVKGEVAAAARKADFSAALDAILRLAQPVADLFAALMVNDPDAALKARRVGLLLEVADTFRVVADFSRISTR